MQKIIEEIWIKVKNAYYDGKLSKSDLKEVKDEIYDRLDDLYNSIPEHRKR